MVYLAGIVGFIGGFCLGQMVLMFLLRHKSNADLKQDKSLRIYGLLNWLVALLGAMATVWLYKFWFLTPLT
ncbi:MAG: hypothetical protein HYU57_02850 [Micavibrio aeruginosavorus]|nr:hypothetical protein [Micavibrio aeruginosavorus]